MPEAKARDWKKRIGTIGALARNSQATKAAARSVPAPSAANLKAVPTGRVAAHKAPHQAERGKGDQRQAREIEGDIRTEAFIDTADRQRHDDGGDRQIDPENPLPSYALRNRAAGDGPGDKRHAGDAAEDPKRPPALLPRERRAQQGHGQRNNQSGAGALNGAPGNQPAGARRERTGCRRTGEQPKAAHEHAAAPKAVTDCRAR